MPPFHSYDGLVKSLSYVPPIIIPDTVEEMWPTAPVPVPLTPPDTQRSLIPIPPAPVVNDEESRLEWLGSIDFFRWELLAVKYGVPLAGAGMAVYYLCIAVMWLYAEVVVIAPSILVLAIAGLIGWRSVRSGSAAPKLKPFPKLSPPSVPKLKPPPKLKPSERPRPEPVRTKRERGAVSRLFLGDDRPSAVPVSKPEPKPKPVFERKRSERGSIGRLFLGDDRPAKGRCNTERSRPRPASIQPTADPRLEGWIADMRNPASKQTTHEFWGDDTHGDTFCAVGWLLKNEDPDGFAKGWGRVPHRAYRAMRREYGGGFIDGIERMNDSGRYSLSQIADYVERKKK